MENISWKNLTLSKLCLGTVQFGLDYGIANQTGKITSKEAEKILDFIIDNGINCFDTARNYGDSEFILGNYLNIKNSNNLKIISKINSEVFLSSYDKMKEYLRISLNNLKTECIFAVLLHDSHLIQFWSEEISKKINKLKEECLIEKFGISIYTDSEFDFAVNCKDIDIIQIPFNIFDQRAIINHWLRRAKKSNKLIFIRSIYLQGLILMDKDKLPFNLSVAKPYIEYLDFICKKYKISRNQLALSFVSQMAKDGIILFGCDNLQQAKENVNNFENRIILDESLINDIKINLSNISKEIYNPINWNKK